MSDARPRLALVLLASAGCSLALGLDDYRAIGAAEAQAPSSGSSGANVSSAAQGGGGADGGGGSVAGAGGSSSVIRAAA